MMKRQKSRKEGQAGRLSRFNSALEGIDTKSFYIIAAAVVIADQLTKRLIVSILSRNESLLPANPIANITLVFNTGAGFGIFKDSTLVLGMISIIVAVGIIIFYRHIKRHDRMYVAMILGGAVGNLIDRLFLGHVIDFISASFFPPVFNIADAAITLGVIGLIYNIFLHDEKTKKAEKGPNIKLKQKADDQRKTDTDTRTISKRKRNDNSTNKQTR